MKLLHCADLHLDAKMTSTLDKERAKERKAELLHTFQDMISYAANHDICHILICGDLFDTKNISASARNLVSSEIEKHPEITFYYLRGNHDADNFLSGLDVVPDNLKLFSHNWTSYVVKKQNVAETGDSTVYPNDLTDMKDSADMKASTDGNVSIDGNISTEMNPVLEKECTNIVISGMELAEDNAKSAYHTLVLDSDKINIVMLHGQESETGAKDKAEVIHLRELHNKGIDYLALGHIHAYKREKLDGRGVYCYSGCLEGRGFDECGEHGFVVLDVDEEKRTVTDTFVPFAKRNLYTVYVDVTGCNSSVKMAEKIRQDLAQGQYRHEDLLKIVLTGALDVACEKNTNYLLSMFSGDYYFVKLYDETTLRVDVEDFQYDESLKGEFVRTVLSADEMPQEEKAAVIRLGLQILNNEEVSL
ncbi:MAG: metallophosphoesterase [Lachnospiraceae bacterium]|nr:metallophosphoesterase [Lachnospiraceae bacterium]